MELGFVISAFKRRWWVIVLSAVLFGLTGAVVLEGPTETYTSEAVLLVLPNSRGGVVQSFGSSDRYVESQLAVINSDEFRRDVSARAGDADLISVDVSNETGTDVVVITVVAASAESAELVAATYAREYIARLTDVRDGEQSFLAESLAADLEEIRAEIERLNIEIAATVQQFLPQLSEGVPIDPAFIDPQTVTERDLLALEYDRVLEQRIAVERVAEIQVNSSILQLASDASFPLVSSSGFELLLAVFTGACLGCVVALVWARFSSNVSDEAMISETLGAPISANVPRHRQLGNTPASALFAPPELMREPIGRLAVAAESAGPTHRATRLVVAGAQQTAGTTTIALLLAHEFNAMGASVTLVDANPRSTDLTIATGRLDATFDDIEALYVVDDDDDDVVTVGSGESGPALARSEVSQLLEQAGDHERVVIIDAGSVLSSAATVELCAEADAVVLAVPLKRQKAATLRAVSRVLNPREMLVATTNPRRRSMASALRPVDSEATVPDTEDETADDKTLVG